jgi:hypothetical protein
MPYQTKLLIEKGVITDEEFKKKLGEERATYQPILKSVEQEHFPAPVHLSPSYWPYFFSDFYLRSEAMCL